MKLIDIMFYADGPHVELVLVDGDCKRRIGFDFGEKPCWWIASLPPSDVDGSGWLDGANTADIIARGFTAPNVGGGC